jgi:hypothetical protein
MQARRKSLTTRAALGVALLLVAAGYLVGRTCLEAKRTDKKEPSKFIQDGRWKDYTPPPKPKE